MIKKYINYRKAFFTFYIAMLLILLLVNDLYQHPLASILYSIVVETFFFIIYICIDYIHFQDRMKYLSEVHKNLTMDRHLLPDTTNCLELEYQRLISSLYETIQSHVEVMEQSYNEQVEYYTMWVHQIKTPISAMQLVLQSNPATEETKLLEQELFKIERYVELALQYTKLRKLSNDLVLREYELDEIVNQSIRKYASLFIYKKLSVQVDEFHQTIHTDSKWLSFILEQLLSNAIKYTNRGGIRITWDKQTLSIRDTGIGIRSEDMERIFEKGYTGYNGRIDKKASGIGLYLSKKVADSLAIRLTIHSEIGKGTTVSLKFPARPSLTKNNYDE